MFRLFVQELATKTYFSLLYFQIDFQLPIDVPDVSDELTDCINGKHSNTKQNPAAYKAGMSQYKCL